MPSESWEIPGPPGITRIGFRIDPEEIRKGLEELRKMRTTERRLGVKNPFFTPRFQYPEDGEE